MKTTIRIIATTVALLLGSAAVAEGQSVAQRAYKQAASCLAKQRGETPTIPFDSVLVATVGDSIRIPLTNGKVFVGRAFYEPETRTIWIMRELAQVQWVLAHEYLHAMGVVGHGREFKRCQLLG